MWVFWSSKQVYICCFFWLILRIIIVIRFFSFLLRSSLGVVLRFDFASFGSYSITTALVIDFASVSFSFTVLYITCWVCFYCVFYIGDDNSHRFIRLLMLFVLSINLFIYIPSFLGIIIGWDGLALTSYLLVSYYKRREALAAGLLTSFVNRVGDRFFILFLAFGACFHRWNYWDLRFCGERLALLILVSFGRMTKSAQVPFSSWLPAAMSAPTPVSTLVHSSTLVTAGVYVLYRFSDLTRGFISRILLRRSVATLMLASLAALLEIDLKKIVAFSTLRQLGLMLFSLSVGMVDVCFFHLLTHAYFKSIIFLCVGVVIYLRGGLQDYRFIGGLWYKMPVISSFIVVCFSCLIGLPFTAGFYSKDMIVEGCFWAEIGIFGVVEIFFSVLLTVFYSVRLIVKSCWSGCFFPSDSINDRNFFAVVPIMALRFGAVLSGVFFQSFVLSFSEYIFLSLSAKILILVVLFCGVWWMVRWEEEVFLYSLKFKRKSFFSWFSRKMWFLRDLTGNPVSSGSLKLISTCFFYLEKGWCSYIFGSGMIKALTDHFVGHHRKMQVGISLRALVLGLSILVFFIW